MSHVSVYCMPFNVLVYVCSDSISWKLAGWTWSASSIPSTAYIVVHHSLLPRPDVHLTSLPSVPSPNPLTPGLFISSLFHVMPTSITSQNSILFGSLSAAIHPRWPSHCRLLFMMMTEMVQTTPDLFVRSLLRLQLLCTAGIYFVMPGVHAWRKTGLGVAVVSITVAMWLCRIKGGCSVSPGGSWLVTGTIVLIYYIMYR